MADLTVKMHLILKLLVFAIVVSEVLALPTTYFQVFGEYANARSSKAGKRTRKGSEGDERYKEICHLHNIDSLMFPGVLGNPICPY